MDDLAKETTWCSCLKDGENGTGGESGCELVGNRAEFKENGWVGRELGYSCYRRAVRNVSPWMMESQIGVGDEINYESK